MTDQLSPSGTVGSELRSAAPGGAIHRSDGGTSIALASPRYVVTELEGYPRMTSGNGMKQGLSCMVVDTLWNHRVLKTYRTEEHNGSRATHTERFERTRLSARSHADILNARG